MVKYAKESVPVSTPKKKLRLVRKTSDDDAGIESMADTVRKHNHRKNMDVVINAMQLDPDLASNLSYMVETGKFSRKQGDSDAMLPASCNT